MIHSLLARRARRGFTLVELLVVIAIIGVLIALLLPAVQQAREAARRMQCTNNLKQLTLATHMHADARQGWLPLGGIEWTDKLEDGGTYGRITWMQQLWPYIEQTALYDGYTLSDPFYSADNIGKCRVPVSAYYCPSDQVGAMQDQTDSNWRVLGNYVANMGNTHLHQPAADQAVYTGAPFGIHHIYKLNHIIDGLSNTALYSELIIAAPGGLSDTRGDILNDDGSPAFMSILTPNSSSPDHCAACKDSSEDSSNNDYRTIPCYEVGTGPTHNQSVQVAARSRHPGGVIVAMCDGSARFVSETISETIWQAAVSSRGGEPQQLP
ncbi:DUF1559 domain-containing protein [Blastopirellula sp. J2-11]|uniref:DUF1559 domain-containing protein n=1 Tax=Blastopirellula sp. J2-11 TaxID=2943192 RepID=UPI0021C8841D|nr:DUF1559 domain-containing protein [Blastopirellula sp. J2-11]UUO06585.1 DUF1559 domain-containing protein [Blastopirellula sp. J2-11]